MSGALRLRGELERGGIGESDQHDRGAAREPADTFCGSGWGAGTGDRAGAADRTAVEDLSELREESERQEQVKEAMRREGAAAV